jgi:hypothetical protein
MTKIFDGVSRGDLALAALMTLLGAFLMIENILGPATSATRVDSHSWLMVPVFAAATIPILWRRRGMLAVLAVTAAALAVHVFAFGWVVRCGAGLPLAFALAYGVGRLSDGWRTWIGLAGAIGIQFLVLVRDSAAGLDIIPVTAVLTVAAWGVGVWLRRRALRLGSVGAPAPAVAHV